MDITINITNITGTQMAAKITGNFVLDNKHKFRFSAVAFGRIGGQNVGAKLSKKTQKHLTDLGYNHEEVLGYLQQKLVQGELSLPEGLRRESFADDNN